MLSEIICIVLAPFPPIDEKLTLFNSVPYPIESHVDRLASFLLNSVIGKADGAGVVCLNRCSWLGISKVGKRGA